MINEYSCGAILFCNDNGTRKYVLIQEASGSYGFPKGHMEGNETPIETATREIFEETGLHPEYIPNLKRTIRYKMVNSIEKEVTFFVAKFDAKEELNPQDKLIMAIKKYDVKVALNMLKFQELKNILIEVDFMLDQLGE